MIYRMNRFIIALIISSLIPIPAFAAPKAIVVRPANLPDSYKLVGEYILNTKIKVEQGESHKLQNTDSAFRVFSNGQFIRVYNTSVNEEFHSYEIYRADGIAHNDDDGNIRVTPGIQARYTEGSLLKHLSVTHDTLTLTDFPPVSSSVIIFQALRKKSNIR